MTCNRSSFLIALFIFLLVGQHATESFCPNTVRQPPHPFILHAKSKKKKRPGSDTVAVNRLAFRNYEVLETYEAGISLLGTEVKSIRDGKLNLRDGFVKPLPNGRSCELRNVHIGKCSTVGAEFFQHEERRPRNLLLHKKEARKLLQETQSTGITVVPLKAYWKNNYLKLQIGLCRGKKNYDKRATIKDRDNKREERRIIKNFRGSSI